AFPPLLCHPALIFTMAEYVVLVRMKDVSTTNIRGLNLGSLDDFAHVFFGKLADARKAESYYSRNPAESYTVKVLDFSASGVWTGPPIVVPPARSAPSPVSLVPHAPSAPSPVSLVPHAPSAPTSGSSVEVEGTASFASLTSLFWDYTY
ncbi:hypothetical protein C5167_021717, partial [Papaver somniferum]